jgi:4-amino-4-deoxy-L-arabinose transferase-like glycosyltransferase
MVFLDPELPVAAVRMADRPSRLRLPESRVTLARVLEGALCLRILAAVLVHWYTRHKGVLCLFPDTRIYWLLAETIAAGTTYKVVQWGDQPYFALRTPGYPLFLAGCRLVFGARVLPVRLVQAVLGTASVWLVYRLTEQVLAPGGAPALTRPSGTLSQGERGCWSSPPLLAAVLAAIDPFLVVTAALVLSEALFIPLMLLSLLGLAVLWPAADDAAPRPRQGGLWAVGTGVASGAAVLVRPSWILFVPLMIAAWLVASLRDRGKLLAAVRGAVLVSVGFVAVMAPWWGRNARIYGRFVPTALWTGASLYDGLNPRATGASDMDWFLSTPDVWPLGEEAQDAELFRRAVAFARAHPRRVLELAAIKAARYWSPWPNAAGWQSPVVTLASALWSLPLLAAMAVGAWDRRRDARTLVLLAGPLVYFALVHMVFASSMRYRIPAAAPGMGLAAIGLDRLRHQLLVRK